MNKCKNNPLSEQERQNGDGCINKGNGVSGNRSFIILTLLKLAIGGILIPYAAQQSYLISMSPKLSLYTYFLPTCQLYGINKVSVIEVLETSWFVFCDHFHHVIKVTTEFCSPSKFSRWLPFVCCPQLHILLFPQCKPPIPVNQLTFIIESLRASVTLMANYLFD
jgi:hypothetical protein